MVVISLFVFKPFRSEPPTPTITAANKEIATTQGSYCWEGLLSAKCVDKIYTSPLEMVKEHKPAVVSPNEVIEIDFKKAPIPETLEVEKWIDRDNIENIVLKNDSIIAPKEKGIYVFHILANWEQGDGNYAFSVEVR
ncbi:hypothetical protein [Pontibacillus sp. HMF3514]|uniref:hypothetical protein n=1 Tax=Pontibacillus sp. HMF3514 TaxID=2692425 RepID=UPI00132051EE|nr:hypothetical protein [Pontibacillus sp. HMF3514]QHE52690.1 hypothetical protein GS400_11895 [Pontibacillus sp. HMF3514]